jgi:hypothetical protein
MDSRAASGSVVSIGHILVALVKMTDNSCSAFVPPQTVGVSNADFFVRRNRHDRMPQLALPGRIGPPWPFELRVSRRYPRRSSRRTDWMRIRSCVCSSSRNLHFVKTSRGAVHASMKFLISRNLSRNSESSRGSRSTVVGLEDGFVPSAAPPFTVSSAG